MSKRICFIRQSVYPYELSVRREVETLARAGYEAHVICLGGANRPTRQPEEINGVFVHRLPATRKKTGIMRYLYDYGLFFSLAALKVAALHRRHPFAAIQINTMPDFLVFAAFIPKLLGAKVVVMMHEPVPELWQTLRHSPPPKILVMAEQSALAYVHTAFTVTQQLKEAYVARGADPQKISVILNAPEPRFLELAEEPPAKIGDDHFTLISHGAIEERYGQDTMLEAIALVKAEIPQVRLRLLGQGNYVDEVVAQIKRLDLADWVQYLGWVSHNQMLQELRAADVGIVAQKSSPYSNLVHTNKMYEYIALNKPVLASRLKSVLAYFDENALAYFEPGNAESLAAGILELYRHPAKRDSLVQNAHRLYEQYQWTRQQEIYLSVYENLLK